jgi:hypothetical protein
LIPSWLKEVDRLYTPAIEMAARKLITASRSVNDHIVPVETMDKHVDLLSRTPGWVTWMASLDALATESDRDHMSVVPDAE